MITIRYSVSTHLLASSPFLERKEGNTTVVLLDAAQAHPKQTILNVQVHPMAAYVSVTRDLVLTVIT